MKYCPKTHKSERWKTREVRVGNIGVGGDNPIRVQSMTTSDTKDVEATVQQVIRLADAGCEIVRMTVQGKKEAEACEHIKNRLIQQGYTVPLVADIHFYPPAALLVADFVEKIRINPGNFADKRATFRSLDYDDEAYQRELERIEEVFSPLVEKCKKLGRALRIGTNHGSLSDRIMNVYGDSPRGMVESALEYAAICRKLEFHNFVFSMKSSNPKVMIAAYRQLVAKQMKLGWNYPLHIGVTEAGGGEDGRVKSACGMGALLLDGLGDTVRVSLTEDPWLEVDPCRRLVRFGQTQWGKGIAPFQDSGRSLQEMERRKGELAGSFLHSCGNVWVEFEEGSENSSDVDAVIVRGPVQDRGSLLRLEERGVTIISSQSLPGSVPLLKLRDLSKWGGDRFLAMPEEAVRVVEVSEMDPQLWGPLRQLKQGVILFSPVDSHVHHGRMFCGWLKDQGIKNPVIWSFSYDVDLDDLPIWASAELGSLLCDGLGDGVHIRHTTAHVENLRRLGYGILQSCRMRSTKTEFISCPSCGRTLFDLQEVTKQVQEKTGHLAGVKIAVMGCIVNGPGEMADADFGYVGSGRGKIDLYVGKDRVERGIPSEDAVQSLVELLKEHGVWLEPAEAASESQSAVLAR